MEREFFEAMTKKQLIRWIQEKCWPNLEAMVLMERGIRNYTKKELVSKALFMLEEEAQHGK